jgi:hypothetical protein
VFSHFYATTISGKDATIENLRTQLDDYKKRLGERTERPAEPSIEKYVCSAIVTAQSQGKYAALLEFGVRGGPTSGFAATIQIDQKISSAFQWRTSPLRTDVPANHGGVTFDMTHEIKDNIFNLSFSQPSLSPTLSEYVYIESENPFHITGVLFLENFNIINDPVTANALAKNIQEVPSLA